MSRHSSLEPIYSTLQRCFIGIGLISNLILINLIIFRSPKDLGLYKYLMAYIICFELFYIVLEFLTVPDLLTLDYSFFIIVDPEKSLLPEKWSQVADLIYCGAFAVSLVIFGCQFAYRYHVLKGNSSWTASTPRNFIFWLGTPAVLASFYSYFVHAFMQRNDYTKKIMRTVGYTDHQIESVGFIGLIFYPKLDNGTQIVNWESFIGVSVTTGTLFASEFTMIYFAFKCFQATKSFINQSGCSSKFRRLQWQLFYALVAQAIIPILFMQIPMTMIYTSTIVLRSSIPAIGHLQSMTISIYLAIDALPTILIIKPYRDTVIRFLFFWKKRKVAPYQTNSSNSKQQHASWTNF
ncbi:hypothetical protein L5515_009316 [Caenorhabditis briggsae]|uniref:Seven TM Receptor n=1 Tax=Caenorhabditis briggsae TaxID=6238 RepID=A0AAE9F9G1_CAEBR|nr:hypothetical protein L5515_009316 [Caenorhabditis briggsae]